MCIHERYWFYKERPEVIKKHQRVKSIDDWGVREIDKNDKMSRALNKRCGVNYCLKDCFEKIEFAVLSAKKDLYNFEKFYETLNGV